MGKVTGVKCKVHVCVYVLGPKYFWAYAFICFEAKKSGVSIWYFMHTNKRINTVDQIRWKEYGG